MGHRRFGGSVGSRAAASTAHRMMRSGGDYKNNPTAPLSPKTYARLSLALVVIAVILLISALKSIVAPDLSNRYPWCDGAGTPASAKCWDDTAGDVTTFGQWQAANGGGAASP